MLHEQCQHQQSTRFHRSSRRKKVALWRNGLVRPALGASSAVVLLFSGSYTRNNDNNRPSDRSSIQQMNRQLQSRAAFARQTAVISGKQIANCKITARHYSIDRETDNCNIAASAKQTCFTDHCTFFFSTEPSAAAVLSLYDDDDDCCHQ